MGAREHRSLSVLVLAALLVYVFSAGGTSGTAGTAGTALPAGPTSPADVAASPLVVRPGVEQLLVLGAAAGEELVVRSPGGEAVASGAADANGALLVRDLAPGSGYVVEHAAGRSEKAEVWGVDDVPDRSLYEDQELVEGYQYLRTRDGTLLAVNVRLPGPIEEGPFPTLVEYSGYDPANPEGVQPLQLMANLLGYATVGVNMRGTGCSGGSFLFFEPAQWTDGYDVIETVAAQAWSTSRVGMIGISYPGISQLFVAKTRPPSLAAITPLSVIADTYRSTLYPGGILNNGFAISWAEGRVADSAPAGQPWAAERIAGGDEVCAANQALRTQNPDLFELIEEAAHLPEDPDGYLGRLAPSEWVDRIEVPVLISGSWQDEQTGGHFATMLDRFTSAPVRRFALTNGGHTEPLIPELLIELVEFLELYVAERVPRLPEGLKAPLDLLAANLFEVPVQLPALRYADHASLEEARAAYEAAEPVLVLFENGAGGQPGAPVPTFRARFAAWPVPQTRPTTWYLGAGGSLGPDPPPEAVEIFTYDTSRSQQLTLDPSANPWAALPPWRWEAPAAGSALAYVTEPLAATTVMVGTGRVDLRFGSDAPDVDLQVTLSEVRPDGNEVYVQSGWLRASHRAIDPAGSGPLTVRHTHLSSDAAPLPEAGFTELSVGIFPFAHVFRAGSRVRLVIDAPGGTRPEWQFDVVDAPPGTTNRVRLGGVDGSRVTLPVIPGLEVPPAFPPCPSLRGQPCRPLAVLPNRPG